MYKLLCLKGFLCVKVALFGVVRAALFERLVVALFERFFVYESYFV